METTTPPTTERVLVKTLDEEAYVLFLHTGKARMPCDANFIHLLFEDQLKSKIPCIYGDQRPVYLLYLRREALTPFDLRVETNIWGTTFYPHLYPKDRRSEPSITPEMVMKVESIV
jgi:uncharacterized protein (DUF952 family)